MLNSNIARGESRIFDLEMVRVAGHKRQAPHKRDTLAAGLIAADDGNNLCVVHNKVEQPD